MDLGAAAPSNADTRHLGPPALQCNEPEATMSCMVRTVGVRPEDLADSVPRRICASSPQARKSGRASDVVELLVVDVDLHTLGKYNEAGRGPTTIHQASHYRLRSAVLEYTVKDVEVALSVNILTPNNQTV
jgi:hypothetical protein